jgi:hypothetical protein
MHLSIEKRKTFVNFVKRNCGRVGAIKLEQLDELLLSLKTYWDSHMNQAFVDSQGTNNTVATQKPDYVL